MFTFLATMFAAFAQTEPPKKADPPPPKPASAPAVGLPATVDQALATALKGHPDIKVAEAKLRLVQAELEQAKLKAMQDQTAAEQGVMNAEQAVQAAETAIRRTQELRKKGMVPETDQSAAELAVVRARAQMMEARQVLDVVKSRPGLKVAEAKAALAAAEVEQARLGVTKGVTRWFATAQNARETLAETARAHELVKRSGAPVIELSRYAIEVQQAKTALVTAEAELTGAIGTAATAEDESAAKSTAVALRYLRAVELTKQPAPTGTAVDKLKAVLDKPVKLDLKEVEISTALNQLFKAAGVEGLTVRGLAGFSSAVLKSPPKVQEFNGEQTVVAWLQMMLDDFNRDPRDLPPELLGKYDLYVREYGLVLSKVDLAAKDAVSLTEFARQVREQKQAENEKAKQPPAGK